MPPETSTRHATDLRILPRLKRETREAHLAIEAVAIATGFLEDPAAYARYLRATYGFHAAIEPKLERALPELAGRSKLAWLREDLAALGVEPDGLAREDALGPLADRAAAFGAAYVIEGSTLGGRFILARLGRSGIARGATRFFSGYGGDTGRMWRSFGDALAGFAAETGRGDAIVAGANETFDVMRAWIAQASMRQSSASSTRSDAL